MPIQPRRRQMRGHYKMAFHTLPPLKPRSKTAELSKLSGLSQERSSSIQPPFKVEKTTSRSPYKTTTWWPSGIYLGHRPPRTQLPLHIINPDLFKWERKFPKIWFRTGGTKFTYAPEVVNYPVTFNWSIPKDKRVDKYTAKPDWPLNSPLFGSNEIYDYLEEVTLPSPPVSGETEFPQTTPQQWWTFPPWWENKVSEQEKYGKKTRPQEAIYLKPTIGTSTSTTEIPVEAKMHIKTLNLHTKHTPPLTRQPLTTPKSFLHTPFSIAPATNVVHHRGPWWKLTVVEHHNPEYGVVKKNTEETLREKRSIYTPKPLVRQNAFRRKSKMNNHHFGSKNKELKITKQNKKYISLMKKITKPQIALFDYSKKQLPNRVLGEFLFNGFLRSCFKHRVNIESLSKVTPTVGKKPKCQEVRTTLTTTTNYELDRLNALQGLLLTKINKYDLKKNKFVLLKHIRGQISKEIFKYQFKKKEQRRVYHNMGKLLLKTNNSLSHHKMLNVLLRNNLINNIKKNDKVLNCTTCLEDRNQVMNFKFATNYVNQKSLHSKIALQSVKSSNHCPRSKREDSTLTQNGEKVKLDLDKATNWSSHSMETVLQEVVNEIPMRTIRTEVKKGILTDLHADKIRSLGRKKINTEVISKMVEFETEDECFGVDQETDKSVKNLIQKLLKEVLFTLRGNKWMKDAIIKIFEDGYSVKSVVEAVVNELSIESILDAMGKEGINITNPQKDMVLSEFKNYKPELEKMLEKEILLWDKEMNNKLISLRRRRSIHMETAYSDFATKVINSSVIVNKLKRTEMVRGKRNIDEINNSHGSLEINREKDYLNIDKEISDLKKSSLPDVEKIKKLKKSLKWLQSQTENPSDIIFPESFEERLMITESYDDDKSKIQRVPKKRYQWSVRTKKPTLKTITFIPKIRLARGKLFVPLTTTEEQLILPTTLKPVIKRKQIKSFASRKKIKTNIDPDQEATLRPAMRPLLLRTNKPDKAAGKYSHTIKPKLLRRLTRKRIVTSTPETTFATLKSFHTMKFAKNTQKQVISLQEFLKRRNEHRREKEEVMWNKNFLHSGGEDLTTRGTPELRDITEENEYSTDEEELSFDAKLSGEIKASDFTLRPLSYFLFTRPTKPHTTELNVISDMTVNNNCLEGITINSKENKTFITNKNRASLKNNSRNEDNKSIGKKISRSMSTNQAEDHSSSIESNGERRKRNIFQLQSDNSFTYKDSPKDKTEEKDNGVDHGTTTHKLDDSLIGVKQNISQRQLELKIQSNSKFRVNTMQFPNMDVEYNTNVTASSFETYQQEHKKWFGVRRRGAPVNNFDIDWDQMRRKLEVQELSVWQKEKGQHKFDGKELRKYWDINSKSKLANEVTTSKTDGQILGTHNKIMNFPYSLDSKSKKYSPFIKNDKCDENKSNLYDNNIQRDSLQPPFGIADKDGKTAFGRLYEEPKKRHYRVFDNRDPFFDEKDIKNLINNTYCADFRIMTHRKTQWHNRTFDPNFIFTQGPAERNGTSTGFRQPESNKIIYDSIIHKAYTAHSNDSKTIDSDFHNYVNALKENRFMSLRPKHHSFKDKDNNTVIINQENDTFILQRSKRIPFDNNTDLEDYKAYKRIRKRFYNKTIDIVFSYYIFHKFKCGNFTRDLGYGRMSNVVNRWYNRTFIPKYRPDMFYVHNRYKAGKEFNYFRNEFNILHSMISKGTFDPSKWGHVLMTRNGTRSSSFDKSELNETEKAKKCMKDKIPNLNSNHKPPALVRFSTEMNIKSPVRTLNPNFKRTQNTTTFRFSIRSHSAIYRSLVPSTRSPFTSITKKSFFKSVKDKGFVFLKSLFGIKNKNNDDSK